MWRGWWFITGQYDVANERERIKAGGGITISSNRCTEQKCMCEC
jgi:hypothetical protein